MNCANTEDQTFAHKVPHQHKAKVTDTADTLDLVVQMHTSTKVGV